MAKVGRKKNPNKKVPRSFRFDPEVLIALDEAAKDDMRTTASMLEVIAKEGLIKRGYLK